jgi:hypothetical protein
MKDIEVGDEITVADNRLRVSLERDFLLCVLESFPEHLRAAPDPHPVNLSHSCLIPWRSLINHRTHAEPHDIF